MDDAATGIRCTAYGNIIFCWVMHEQDIIDHILSRLDTSQCKVHAVSLICTGEALQKRLQRDVDMGIRKADVVLRSLERVRLYEALDTARIDVSDIPPEQAAELILKL